LEDPNQVYVMKAGFKMPQRPNSSHLTSASTSSLPQMF
jgi:hypothetical protein